VDVDVDVDADGGVPFVGGGGRREGKRLGSWGEWQRVELCFASYRWSVAVVLSRSCLLKLRANGAMEACSRARPSQC
jgi:hypothetical protein